MKEKEAIQRLKKLQMIVVSELDSEAISDALDLIEEKDHHLKNLSEIIDNKSKQIKRLEKEIENLKSNNSASFTI